MDMVTHAGPVGGIDYPRNFQEFERWFADEPSCRSYVLRVRWPDGYQCVRCESKALAKTIPEWDRKFGGKLDSR